jgi:integrase
VASIRKRGDKWIAQVLLQDRKYRAKSFPTKPLAVAWARDLEAARDRGDTIRDPGLDKVTVGQLWEPFVTIRRGVLSPNTVAKNTSHWRIHLKPTFAGMPAAGLRRSHVEAWVAEQVTAGRGVPTVGACVALLSALLESAVEDGIITANPVLKVRMPKHQPKRRRFITGDELGQVLDQVEHPDDRLLLDLMANTGLRIGEALGLTASDVARDGSTVSVHQVWTRHGYKPIPKGDLAAARRTVPVPAHIQPALREHVRLMLPAAVLFHGDDRNINRRILAPACEAADLEWVTLHELRHHAASVWIAAGVPLFEVARALGHTSTRMVEATYGHLTPGAHDRLRAAMDTAYRALS